MKQGFTLLEVVLSVAIILTGLLAITKAMNAGLLASGDADQSNLIALSIAESRMEEIKDTSFVSLQDSGPAADANFPDYDVTVNVAEGTDPMQVDVSVSWQTNSGPETITLTTAVANI